MVVQYGAISGCFETARTTLIDWGIKISLKRIERLTYYFGQSDVVPKTIVQHTTQVCNEDGYYTVAPPPAYIYNPYPIYVSPYPTYGINFGFGRGFHFGFGGGFHRWGHYRRW